MDRFAVNPPRASGLGAGYVACMLAGLAALGLYQAIVLPTNCDVAWYLYAGARILNGARLGTDVVEVNAPLVILLSMGVEGIARLVGCSSLVVFPVIVSGLAWLSVLFCAWSARRWPAEARLPFLLALGYVLFVHVGGMFGQREHLLLILVLPYVCTTVQFSEGTPLGRPVAVATGIAAGVGFALKPFFVPAWFAIEAYLVYRGGFAAARRAQAVAVWAVFAAYAILILLWSPGYLVFAFESFALYRDYQPYGDLPLLASRSFGLVALAVALARTWPRNLAPMLIDGCSILALGLSVAVFLQGKGWHYQWYPAVAIAMVLIAMSAVSLGTRRLRLGGIAVQSVCGLLVLCLCVRTYGDWKNAAPEHDELSAVVRQHAGGEPILALSSHLHAGFPLVNETGARWASRYPTMWQLSAFVERKSPPNGMHSDERQFIETVLADFVAAPPAVLLVDSVPPRLGLADFSYLEYFEREPRLASLFQEYRLLRQIGRYRVLIHTSGSQHVSNEEPGDRFSVPNLADVGG